MKIAYKNGCVMLLLKYVIKSSYNRPLCFNEQTDRCFATVNEVINDVLLVLRYLVIFIIYSPV